MYISRRHALGTLAGSLLSSAQVSSRPNVLLVLSDDHSTPWLGTYGADWLKTPNLDQFARDGMVFERAFTAAPQCVPSRTALMTGRSPVAARMGRFSSPLPRDVITAPEVMRSRGYYTGVCGRYFHLDGVVSPSPVTAAVYEKHQLRTWKNRVDYLDISPQGGTAQRFEEFLGRVPNGRPWFFWINYSDPHHPWDRDAGSVNPEKVRVPRHLPDLPGIREDLAAYSSEIERADRLFGEAMSVLRQRSLEAGTMVVFMGDNGMAFPHGKGSLYDPGINVPLIARWPGRIRPGRTRTLVSGEDIAATFMHVAGGEIPAGVTGRSLYPLLTGAKYEGREHVFAARLHHGNSSFTAETKAATFDLSRCVRSDRYKLIYNLTPQMEYWPVDSAANPGWQQMLAAHRAGTLSPEYEKAYFTRPRPVLELYDLESDPGELNNVADQPQFREIQQSLMAALQEKLVIDHDFVPPVINEAVPRTPPRKV
jgi:arylsulfatase A-like enzyme